MNPAPDRHAPCFVAGHRGLVGGAVWRALERAGYDRLVGRSSSALDLRERSDVLDFFATERPATVVLAAARVGGIVANRDHPTQFLSDNVRIQTNVMDAALAGGVDRLLFLGSSCLYPRLAPQPLVEEALMTGHLEPTNEAYAIAKMAGLAAVRAARRQFGVHWVSVLPTNVYGPGDDFSAVDSHVVAALIRRYEAARVAGEAVVTNWGTGTPRRDLLHADDLGEACRFVLEHYDDDLPVNVGTGRDATIAEIARLVAEVVGYEGRTAWDPSRPDGTPRKLLDVTRLRSAGWTPSIDLRDGLSATLAWFRGRGGVGAAEV